MSNDLLGALQARAQSMDVQIKKAKPMQPQDVAWERLKQSVENLPANLNTIGKMIVDCEHVKQSTFGKCGFQGKCNRQITIVEAVLEKEPHSLSIIAHVCPEHEYKTINYVATNTQRNVVYVRSIVKSYDPQ